MLPFVKMQAVGNDFVVLEENTWPDASDWSKVAIRLCDRRFGVGGDGLLVIGESVRANLRMRMFNPDGTEDMCGNGLRCTVRRAFDRGRIPAESTIETLSGIRRAQVHLTNDTIACEMGMPSFDPQKIPVQSDDYRNTRTYTGKSYMLNSVDTGSTHTVIWCDKLPEDAEFFAVSPQIETDALFPVRTSVLWTKKADADTLKIRIWERGAGETLGCGTGASAAAVMGICDGKVAGQSISVHSKGGALLVQWNADANTPIWLTGTAQTVYEGNLPDYGAY